MQLFAHRNRKRVLYAFLVLLVICLGLASRRYSQVLPEELGKYPGDALWALMVFLIFGILQQKWSTAATGAVALAACYAVEFSQLYQEPWLNTVRQTTFGHFVLGSHFHAQDLLAYAVGIFVGVMVEFVAATSTSPRL